MRYLPLPPPLILSLSLSRWLSRLFLLGSTRISMSWLQFMSLNERKFQCIQAHFACVLCASDFGAQLAIISDQFSIDWQKQSNRDRWKDGRRQTALRRGHVSDRNSLNWPYRQGYLSILFWLKVKYGFWQIISVISQHHLPFHFGFAFNPSSYYL